MAAGKRMLREAEPQVAPRVRQPAQVSADRTAQPVAGQAQIDPAALTPQSILQLQRTIGNRAVGQLLAQQPRVQRTIIGATPDGWARGKRATAHMTARLLDFARRVHQEDLIFEASELDDFYAEHLAGKSHSEVEATADLYYAFRRFVARIRDAEGAHGHERHAGTGDQFIVDRVNRGGPATASYLEMDEYLTWDSVLKTGADDIFTAYLDLAGESINEFAAYAKAVVRPPHGAAGPANGITAQQGNNVMDAGESFEQGPQTIPVDFARQRWTLTLKTYLRKPALQPGDDGMKLKVGASIEGSRTLKSRTVTRPGGGQAGLGDVTPQDKRPEAYTGGLAPEFKVNNQIEPVVKPEEGALNWVTKF